MSKAVSEARAITTSLRRVRQTVQSGVLQANAAVYGLEEDGEHISDTQNEHKYKLKEALATTKMRLSRVKSAEKNEKYLTFASISFFTSVVLYIILRRTRILAMIWYSMAAAIWANDRLKNISCVDEKCLSARGRSSQTDLAFSAMLTDTSERQGATGAMLQCDPSQPDCRVADSNEGVVQTTPSNSKYGDGEDFHIADSIDIESIGDSNVDREQARLAQAQAQAEAEAEAEARAMERARLEQAEAEAEARAMEQARLEQAEAEARAMEQARLAQAEAEAEARTLEPAHRDFRDNSEAMHEEL